MIVVPTFQVEPPRKILWIGKTSYGSCTPWEPPSGSHCSHETIGKESRLRIAHLQHEPFFGERVVEGTNASWATKGTNKNTGSPRFCLQVMGDSCRFSTSLDSSIHRGWKMATKPLIVVREAGPACPWHRGCSTKSRNQ